MTAAVCLFCTNLPGCKLLIGPKKKFSLDLVIKPEDNGTCQQYAPVTPRLHDVRLHLFESTGAGCLRVLHKLPAIISEDLLRAEQEEEYAMSETPDLASIITEEMTVDQRREQLLHVTDDNGDVVLEEDGQPIVRPAYELRNFAVSGDYHVQLPRDVAVFRSTTQVVDDIIKKELELGLITKNSKPGKAKPKASKPAPKAKKAEETRETMPGKKVIVRNRKNQQADTPAQDEGGGGGGGGRSISRPRRTAGPKAKTQEEAGPAHVEHAPPAADVGDLVPALVEAIVPAVTEQVGKMMTEMLAAAVDDVIGKDKDFKGLRPTMLDLLKAITIQHDIIVQVIEDLNKNIEGLSLDGYNQMFSEPKMILSYIEQAEGGN